MTNSISTTQQQYQISSLPYDSYYFIFNDNSEPHNINKSIELFTNHIRDKFYSDLSKIFLEINQDNKLHSTVAYNRGLRLHLAGGKDKILATLNLHWGAKIGYEKSIHQDLHFLLEGPESGLNVNLVVPSFTDYLTTLKTLCAGLWTPLTNLIESHSDICRSFFKHLADFNLALFGHINGLEYYLPTNFPNHNSNNCRAKVSIIYDVKRLDIDILIDDQTRTINKFSLIEDRSEPEYWKYRTVNPVCLKSEYLIEILGGLPSYIGCGDCIVKCT